MTAAVTQLFNWSTGRCYTVAAETEKDWFMRERFRQGRGCSAQPSPAVAHTQGLSYSAQSEGENGMYKEDRKGNKRKRLVKKK